LGCIGCGIWHTENMSADYASFLERRADLCGGEPVVKGTRVTLRTVLASLAEGASVQEILADFPTLTESAVRASLPLRH
jgi:uncharacterized protein (DUF433 family)